MQESCNVVQKQRGNLHMENLLNKHINACLNTQNISIHIIYLPYMAGQWWQEDLYAFDARQNTCKHMKKAII